MTQLLTCPRGHQWERDLPDPLSGSAPLVCPVCGATVRPGMTPVFGLGTVRDTPRPCQALNEIDATAETVAPPPSTAVTGEAARPKVAEYQILGELGRGGMGVVYKAHQLSLDRLVALKMILAGSNASLDELSRFHREASAAARLDHPNIVHIYEVGEHEGQPYLSLEFVEGGSLAAHTAGKPMPVRQAAQLIETLARAIHVAHQHEIVHRDLKPANILLMKDGTPKITDFGLAKQLNANVQQTQSGALMGTPNYMSPEQTTGHSHDIGPGTDIYSLGAILYELLTGRPPFQGETLLATLEQVRRQEPVPPRSLQPKVPHDLDTICLKCLEKEPRKRYASAEALADDLRRFLDGVPVRARPVSRPERAWRWVHRRPLEAAFAAVSLLGVAAVVFIGVEENIKARDRRANEEIQRQKEIADQNFHQASKALSSIFGLVSQGDLLSVGEDEQNLRLLLTRLMKHYQDYANQRADDPLLQADLADACERLAAFIQTRDNKADALHYYEKAEEVYKKLLQNRDEPETRDRLAEVRLNRGILFQDFGEFHAAENELKTARSELAALTATHPESLDYRRHLAEAHHNLGILYSTRSERHESLAAYQQALAIRRQLVRESNDRVYRRDLARSHGYIGDVQLDLGQTAEALQSYEESHRLRLELAQSEPADIQARFQLARSFGNLSNFHAKKQELAEAIKARQEAWKLQQDLVEQKPSLSEYQSDLAGSCNALAELRMDSGEWDRAEKPLERAQRIYGMLVQRNPKDTGSVLGLVRNHADWAKYRLKAAPAEAAKDLKKAKDRLATLRKLRQDKLEPDELYIAGVVQALEGLLVDDATPRCDAAEQAADSLRQAVQNGFRDIERLERDACLKTLWSQGKFAALVGELKPKTKTR